VVQVVARIGEVVIAGLKLFSQDSLNCRVALDAQLANRRTHLVYRIELAAQVVEQDLAIVCRDVYVITEES